MKKFLFATILLVSTFCLSSFSNDAKAQVLMAQTDPAGATSTVNTNADTSYHSITLSGQTFNYDKITITVAGTKTSGTVAGNVIIQGSNDNSRWFTLYGRTNALPLDTTYTQALTDADNNLVWHFSNTYWKYMRVRVITSGTQVSSYACRFLGRKVPN